MFPRRLVIAAITVFASDQPLLCTSSNAGCRPKPDQGLARRHGELIAPQVAMRRPAIACGDIHAPRQDIELPDRRGAVARALMLAMLGSSSILG